jgi:hypothetical protein
MGRADPPSPAYSAEAGPTSQGLRRLEGFGEASKTAGSAVANAAAADIIVSESKAPGQPRAAWRGPRQGT